MSQLNIFTLKNQQGMEVDILNLGAIVSAIRFPVNGQLKEMTLTYGDVNNFVDDPFYLGATCGRFANRIANGEFSLADRNYKLTQNNDGNCLHGGVDGFTHRYWQVEKPSENSLLLTLTSPDGDQGFPGELEATVRYELTENNELVIDYSATTDAATIVNLCNHCYFHLGENDISALSLKINSNEILVLDNSVPTGEIRNINGSDFDFNQTAQLDNRMANYKDDMLDNMGYDHCYVISDDINKMAAELSSSDVKLTILTDQPGLQFYTAAYLSEPFKPFQALCLEAQNYPDAINHQHFPTPVLNVGEEYKKRVIYQFSTL